MVAGHSLGEFSALVANNTLSFEDGLKLVSQRALAMQKAWEKTRPGVRQCDLMADILSAQIKGTSDFGGDITALHPLILAGEAASTAHLQHMI